MKLNQATGAAFFAATLTSSSSAASVSSHDELKDKIAPLPASKPNRYLRRMLQSSDQCIADLFDTESYPTFNNAVVECASVTVVGNTITHDYSACDLSLLTEGCSADNGTIVAGKWGDIGVDCTSVDQSVKYILKDSPMCIAPSCVSEWESRDDQMSDEFVKAIESFMSQAGEECKFESSSAGASGIKAMKFAAIVIGIMLGNFLVFSWRKKKMKKEEEKKKAVGAAAEEATAAPEDCGA